MNEPRGWVFYDGSCRICQGGVERYRHLLNARGYGFASLQTPWVRERLNLPEGVIPEEVKVLTHEQKILGGADALLYLASQIWWVWPLGLLGRLPFFHQIAKALYRWVAKNRYCLSGVCRIHKDKS